MQAVLNSGRKKKKNPPHPRVSRLVGEIPTVLPTGSEEQRKGKLAGGGRGKEPRGGRESLLLRDSGVCRGGACR